MAVTISVVLVWSPAFLHPAALAEDDAAVKNDEVSVAPLFTNTSDSIFVRFCLASASKSHANAPTGEISLNWMTAPLVCRVNKLWVDYFAASAPI